jgi:glyoxylase-like metal-dependent hydrolase (beta-lactamase superfamily II)
MNHFSGNGIVSPFFSGSLTKDRRADIKKANRPVEEEALMSRRSTVLVFGLIMLAVAAAAGQAPQAKPSPQAPAPLSVQPIAKNLYLVKGGAGANAAFYVAPKQVVVIDAKMTPEAAAGMIAEIAKVTPRPVTTVILTHSDGDHINGLPGFPEGLTIIAHRNVKRDMEKAAADLPALKGYLPTLVYTTKVSSSGASRDIGLRNFGPAHTDGDTCVFFRPLGVVFVGDLAFVGRDPLVHRQKGGTTIGYVKTLEALLSVKPPVETFLSGHADPLTRADIEALKTSLADKLAKVKEMVAAGKSLEEVTEAFGIEAPPDAPGGRRRWLSFVETAYLELTGK